MLLYAILIKSSNGGNNDHGVSQRPKWISAIIITFNGWRIQPHAFKNSTFIFGAMGECKNNNKPKALLFDTACIQFVGS